jgi:electron transport complex protein RnfC
MMGHAQSDMETMVTKAVSGILCFSKDEVSTMMPSACINCGRCTFVCPEKLLPVKLAAFAEREDQNSFDKFHGQECYECGCCSYICPAKRNLTAAIKALKGTT